MDRTATTMLAMLLPLLAGAFGLFSGLPGPIASLPTDWALPGLMGAGLVLVARFALDIFKPER